MKNILKVIHTNHNHNFQISVAPKDIVSWGNRLITGAQSKLRLLGRYSQGAGTVK